MKSKLFGLLAAVCFCILFVQPVKAEELYQYDSGTNVYTIRAKSGNITEAVNQALNVMQTSAAKRGTLVIQPGEYNVNLINLSKSYVTIKAEGATLKFMGSDVNGQYLIKCTKNATTGIILEGGIWDGNKKASYIFNFGSESKAASNLTIRNCTLKNAIDSNLRLVGGKNVLLENVSCTNTEYGIDIKKASGVKIKNSTIYTCEVGIDLRNLSGTNTIENCSVTRCNRVGMQIKEKPTAVTVTGGVCNQNATGISLTTGAKLTLKGIDVSNNRSNGISPVGSKTKKTILNISDSSFNNNGRHGVAAANYVEVTARDSEMNGNTSNGVMLRDYCSSKGLINLTTNSNTLNGILIQGKSTCSLISGCTALKNKSNGLMLVDVAVKLEKVNASQNKACGVFASSTARKNITIKNSTFKGNTNNGLYVSENGGLVISGTKIQNNKNSGIESNGGVIKLNGKSNTVSGNKKYGVCMRATDGAKGELQLSYATVSNNGNVGVCFYGNVTGYCVNATLTNNLTGILIADGANVKKINSNTIKDHSKYGISVYPSTSKKTTTLVQCKDNTLSNPKAANEIVFWSGAKVPAKFAVINPLKIDKTVKAGKKTVTGTVTSGYKVTVTANGRKYKAKKASTNGTYSVKASKLKRGKNVEVMITDYYKNKILASKKL